MSSNVYFSIIVLNWNGSRLLRDCLASLQKQTFRNFEVVVVDNGSVDDSCELVRSKFQESRLLALKENLGFAAGNNQGFSASTGSFILFLNNDTEADPGMLQAIYDAIQKDTSRVAAWALTMLCWDDRTKIDNCGCAYTAFGSGLQIGHAEKYEPARDGTKLIFGASGGGGCYRRAVLDEIGLFDEDFFYNNEDVDLNFRMQLAGYSCRYVPDAIVYHRGSATAGIRTDRTIYHILRNKEWVFYKNMPYQLLIKYLIPHFFYNICWLVFWTLHGKGVIAFRAYLHAALQWRSVLQKRKLVQMCRRSDWRYIDHLIIKWYKPIMFCRWFPGQISKSK
jgi:GT2 family glycosyltransferase